MHLNRLCHEDQLRLGGDDQRSDRQSFLPNTAAITAIAHLTVKEAILVEPAVRLLVERLLCSLSLALL